MRRNTRLDLTRRGLLTLSGSAAAMLALPAMSLPAWAQTPAAPEVFMGDKVYGDPDAPVTLVEYASLACSHCAEFHKTVWPVLKKEFIDPGQVKMIFRDYPLNEPGIRAAMLARCAGEARYDAVKDILFKTQAQWLNPKFNEQLQRFGAMAGISKAQYDACMANKALETSILESQMKASNGAFKVSSTPTFIINDDEVVTGVDQEALFEALEDAGAKRSAS